MRRRSKREIACPNEQCAYHGKLGQGNIAIHGGFALTTLLAGAAYVLLGHPSAALLARRTAS